MHDTLAGCGHLAEYLPRDGHRYVDITEHESTGLLAFRTGTLENLQVHSWLDDDKTFRAHEAPTRAGLSKQRLRLFIASPVETIFPGRRRYPFSLDLFHYILGKFHIPRPFANFAVSHTSLALDLDEEETASPQDAGSEQKEPSRHRRFMLILGPLALAISADETTGSISAIALGFCHHQVSKLIAQLEHLSSLAAFTILVPVIWLNIVVDTRARRVLGRKQNIFETELELGNHVTIDNQSKPLQDIDFSLITRRLTIVSSEISWDIHAIEAQLEMIALIENLHEPMGSSGDNAPPATTTATELHMLLRHMRQVLAGLRLWTHDNQRRAQVQLQTIYSLVSQRDNQISFATAASSQRIAEAAQRDSAIMKQLAEDSRALSIRAWRDGADMRIIAVVNLITLPGTFIATLFSTSFFNFQPQDAPTIVSSWIWLYIAATVGLTLVFVGAWYILSRGVARTIERTERAQSPNAPAVENTKMLDIQSGTTARPHTERSSVVTEAPGDQRCAEEKVQSAAVPDRCEARLVRADGNSRDLAPMLFPPERNTWHASSAWGTQSLVESGEACAMCATSIR